MKNNNKNSINNRRSNTNIWSKVARVGWVFQRTATPKQRQKQQQRAATIGSSSNKSNTTNKSEQQKRQQKQHKQKEKQHTQEKRASSSSKHGTKQHKKQQTQYKHFGRHNNSSKEARMRGTQPKKKRPRGVGPRRVGGGEEERLPMEFRWDSSKFCYNWMRSKGFRSIVKLFLTFWKVNTAKVGEGGGFDGRRPKSSNKSSSKSTKKQ